MAWREVCRELKALYKTKKCILLKSKGILYLKGRGLNRATNTDYIDTNYFSLLGGEQWTNSKIYSPIRSSGNKKHWTGQYVIVLVTKSRANGIIQAVDLSAVVFSHHTDYGGKKIVFSSSLPRTFNVEL